MPAARFPTRTRSGERVERKRGRAGQRQRLRRLQRTNGLCEICLVDGRTEVAVIVDHVVPLALGGLDVDGNTRNLCRRHDLQVTAEQFGHRVTAGGKGVAANGRPTSPDHPWNIGKSGLKPRA